LINALTLGGVYRKKGNKSPAPRMADPRHVAAVIGIRSL
jgi:hypothetical protein